MNPAENPFKYEELAFWREKLHETYERRLFATMDAIGHVLHRTTTLLDVATWYVNHNNPRGVVPDRTREIEYDEMRAVIDLAGEVLDGLGIPYGKAHTDYRQTKEENATLRQALESIIIRCDEGDKRVDWLPTISQIAKRALGVTP